MVQNVLLIWLDDKIDENNKEYQNILIKLRDTINVVNIFTDSDECVQFIEDIRNEKITIIVSGAFGHIVPRIHPMPQIDSILVYSTNKSIHEGWAKNWPKIKGVFVNIDLIYEALKQIVVICEQNSMCFSFVPMNDSTNEQYSHQIDATFEYFQIIKELILSTRFEQHEIKDFFDYCREEFIENENQLVNISNIELNYDRKTPISWYISQILLYSMLNRAFRLFNVETIIKMGFFIKHLHQHIENLHREQLKNNRINQVFKVYRGQGISKDEFHEMKNSDGGLIAFNNFFIAHKTSNLAHDFADESSNNPDLVGVLFVITIDPSLSESPFVFTSDISRSNDDDDEVLFSINTIFRINKITSVGKTQHRFQVDLMLIGENDRQLREAMENITMDISPDGDGWFRLGFLLIQSGQLDRAIAVYEFLLTQTTSEKEKAIIFHRIGYAKDLQGEYEEALSFYEEAIGFQRKILPTNHPDLAKSYNQIGMVYYEMGDYPSAFSSFDKAIKIQEKSLSPKHPDIAKSYICMGLVYDNIGEYSKALLSHERALEIQQESLPTIHPDLASTYNNIGNVYGEMGEYSKELRYHEKALEIRKQILAPNHPDLAMSYNNIGNAYDSMGEYLKALSFHEIALEIRKKAFSSTHPDLAMSYNNIAAAYENMNDYTKAHSYYERAFDLGSKGLPFDHSHLQIYKKNLERIKTNL